MTARPATRVLGRGLPLPFRASVAPVALALDSVVSGTNNTAVSTPITTSAFTPTTSDAIVMLGMRKSITSAYAAFPVPSIGGVSCVKIDGAEQSGQSGNAVIYVYMVRGLTPGVSTALLWPGNGTNSPGKLVAMVFCLSNWPGNVGVHAATAIHIASSTAAGALTDIPLEKSASLILGMAYGTDFSVQPFTASGFTAQASARTSSSGTTGAGTAFSKVGGDMGGGETLTPIAAAAWTDFGLALVEVY